MNSLQTDKLKNEKRKRKRASADNTTVQLASNTIIDRFFKRFVSLVIIKHKTTVDPAVSPSVQPLSLGDEARRAAGGGQHGQGRGHRPLRAAAGGQRDRVVGVPGGAGGAERQRVRCAHRGRVAPARELPGDEQVLQQGPGLHDGGQQAAPVRQGPLGGEHLERGVGRRPEPGAGLALLLLPGRGRRRGGAELAAPPVVGGRDGVEERVHGGRREAAVGVGDAGRDERRRGLGSEEAEALRLVPRVVALLGHLAHQVRQLGDALLLPPQLLPRRLQLQRGRQQGLLQLRHALLRNHSTVQQGLASSMALLSRTNKQFAPELERIWWSELVKNLSATLERERERGDVAEHKVVGVDRDMAARSRGRMIWIPANDCTMQPPLLVVLKSVGDLGAKIQPPIQCWAPHPFPSK
uniref:Uncharacterized protein n=1 Tax=Zea mays TaxID=4577 RepID=A0A804QV06_MAIZE